VVNGTRATIVRIHPAARTIEAVDDRGVQVALPGGYLDAGHVMHGYAITGHKAQGLTVDHTYTLGTETLYREWGYVAMSRGRHTNQLYHGPAALDDEPLHHTHIEDRDDVTSLTSRLRRTRAETPISPQLADIAAAWQQLTAQLDTIDIPRQQTLLNQRDRLDRDRRMLGDRVERLHRQLQHETAGFPWPKRRQLVQNLHTDHDRTATRLEEVTRQLATIDAVIAHQGLPDRQALGAMFQRREQLDTQLGRAATTRIHSYRTHPPDHLTDLLGPRPTDPRAGERWDHTATRIEHHRLRYHLTGSDDPLGERTPNPRARQHAADLRDEIRRVTDQLRHDPPPKHIGAVRR
jgi:hypothetical protein